MSDAEAEGRATGLVLEFDLDAPAEKVWRAIDRPDLRARWLPGQVLTEVEPLASPSGREARFRMRDDEPPFAETTVTFRVLPREGGSILRITHDIPTAETLRRGRRPADGDGPPLMLAA